VKIKLHAVFPHSKTPTWGESVIFMQLHGPSVYFEFLRTHINLSYFRMVGHSMIMQFLTIYVSLIRKGRNPNFVRIWYFRDCC